jgi:hypothetical protein
MLVVAVTLLWSAAVEVVTLVAVTLADPAGTALRATGQIRST